MHRLAIVAALALTACSTSGEPTQAEMKAKWEEGNVAPTNYKADMLTFLRSYLNEPSNVRGAAISPPARKTALGDPGERYIACVRFNARNSSGQYAGVKTGAAVYFGGKLERFLDTPRDARVLCTDVAFEPFPELERLKR